MAQYTKENGNSSTERKQNMEQEHWKSQEILILIWVLKHIKVLGNKIKCQVTEYINMRMVQLIEENGRITSITVKVNINFQMVLSMREIGKIISCMVRDCMLILKVENGRVNLELVDINQNFRRSWWRRDRLFWKKVNWLNKYRKLLVTCWKQSQKVIKKHWSKTSLLFSQVDRLLNSK